MPEGLGRRKDPLRGFDYSLSDNHPGLHALLDEYCLDLFPVLENGEVLIEPARAFFLRDVFWIRRSIQQAPGRAEYACDPPD